MTLKGSGTISKIRTLSWITATILVLLWSDWPTVRGMFERWTSDPRYSHGLLVPIFSGYLLWSRRHLCPVVDWKPSWWGLILIATGVVSQILGALVFFSWLEGLALILVLSGVVTIWGGFKGLKWAAPSIGFLIFMIPLPYRIEVAMGDPLQRIGTLTSTYALQTLGISAIAEGNTIRLNDQASIAVVEACNGLGMLAAFACYVTGAAIVMVHRNLLTRFVLLASAVPLALVSNVTRITLTGLVHATLGGGAADLVFHDLAGWLMMPLALLLLWCELAILDALIVKDNRESIASSIKQNLRSPA